jgi:hypothetical protein
VHSRAKSLTVNCHVPGTSPPCNAVCARSSVVFGTVIMPVQGDGPP